MKRTAHNQNGYKVCYKEEGKHAYVRYFLTYTYKQALRARNSYIRYPPRERETGRKLNNPKWAIIPVTEKEVQDGIWRECPF